MDRFKPALLAIWLVLALVPRAALGQGIPDPIPGPIPAGDVTVGLETVASGLVAPIYATHANDGTPRLFVADRPGQIWVVDLETGARSLFLDLSGQIVPPVPLDERGLIGLAFHPDYAVNGRLYTFAAEFVSGPADFTVPLPPGAIFNHQSVITEWVVPDPEDPASVADPASRRDILRIDQPQNNHNGGCIVFGPDGLLHISFGDGGGGEDEGSGHGATGNGQNIENVLGTILRIDVDGRDAPNGQYSVPADNPFVGMPGIDEIYAYGFRNPFRFSIDPQTGDIHAADVGQRDIEEVNLVVKGGNYGWNFKEGRFFFIPNGSQPGFITDVDPGVPPGLIDPIASYDHDEGIAIIGGFVYRGMRIGKLSGRYVFGEFQKRLFYLDERDDLKEIWIEDGSDLSVFLMGFGLDGKGEIYVLGNTIGFPLGTTGRVLKILPPDTDSDGVRDPDDNCPFTPNDQADRGGLGEHSAPDGIGDRCQCGDVDVDGFVTKKDFQAIMASQRRGNFTPLPEPALCDVGGAPGCSREDALILRLAINRNPPRMIAQQCPPAKP